MILSLLAALTAPALAGLPSDLGSQPGATVGDDEPETPVDDVVALAIINGEEAATDDYPMTGATIIDAYLDSQWGSGPFRTLSCSSTLIAPDVVLLAAHCVDPDSYTYGMGELSDVDIRWTREADLTAFDGRRISEWPEDAVQAVAWVTPDEWDLFGMETGIGTNYDIALLFLSEPLDIPHAYLPTAEEAAQLAVDTEVVVVGWGQQEATSFGEQPPAGTYALKRMGVSYINELGEAEFQVGGEEADVRKCHGDSGGPSFATLDTESPERMRLVGVTSHAYDRSDCNRTGGVDTRVDFYLDWIDAEMRAACADGTRAWCEQEGIIHAPIPVEEDPEEEEGKDGLLSCSSAPGSTGGLALGLGLLALALRRRR